MLALLSDCGREAALPADHRCESCSALGKSSKRVEFATFPRQLLISLERVEISESGRQRKASTPIELPERLELKDTPYLLSGVVVHQGSRRHYTCVGIERSSGTLPDYWHFDDQEVTRLAGGFPELQARTLRFGIFSL